MMVYVSSYICTERERERERKREREREREKEREREREIAYVHRIPGVIYN